jgi:hypothetical protein
MKFANVSLRDSISRSATLPAETLPLDHAAKAPGVDVMVTIFFDFSQFSAKKLAFFSNINVMIIFFKI